MANKRTRKVARPVPTAPDETTVIALRGAIRDVLRAMPAGRGATRAVIVSGLKGLGYGFSEAELEAAIEWNHSRNLIDYRHDHDLSVDFWHLTEKGAAK